MKTIYLLLLSFLILQSCDKPEGLQQDFTSPISTQSSSFFERGLGITPENNLNPYDLAGELHNTLFDAYFTDDSLGIRTITVAKEVSNLAKKNSKYLSLCTAGIPTLSELRISYLIDEDNDRVFDVANTSFSSTAAKLSFTKFADSLVALYKIADSYTVLYNFIADYEDEVMSSSISPADQKIILITTSIARYSTYHRPKRPKKNTDPEWDLMVGNLVGGVEGATESVEKAITLSLATGISENYK